MSRVVEFSSRRGREIEREIKGDPYGVHRMSRVRGTYATLCLSLGVVLGSSVSAESRGDVLQFWAERDPLFIKCMGEISLFRTGRGESSRISADFIMIYIFFWDT